jgi:regulator of protease activity HflC (stomatin/prohibitin superfamily)
MAINTKVDSKSIEEMLRSGKSDSDLLKLFTEELNAARDKIKAEDEAKAKKEAEARAAKEKAQARRDELDYLREEAARALVDYFFAVDDVDYNLEDWDVVVESTSKLLKGYEKVSAKTKESAANVKKNKNLDPWLYAFDWLL